MNKLKPYYQKSLLEAGVDEAGRGCLSGPVVAAAVILPKGFEHHLLNDSKQLSKKHRDEMEVVIKGEAIVFHIGVIDNVKIDEINILKATFRAMNIAINGLSPAPDFLLIDGNRFTPETFIPFKCFVKGDATYASIAAASIIAKTHRDNLMKKMHEEYPQYNWLQNKGYPTEEHRKAILKYGVTPYHRLSFRLLDNEKQLGIDFKV
ncbi:ribonuclease HII [Bacteroidota bacterium]